MHALPMANQQKTQEKADSSTSLKKKHGHLRPPSAWPRVVNPAQRNVRLIRRIHFNLSVSTHPQSLKQHVPREFGPVPAHFQRPLEVYCKANSSRIIRLSRGLLHDHFAYLLQQLDFAHIHNLFDDDGVLNALLRDRPRNFT